LVNNVRQQKAIADHGCTGFQGGPYLVRNQLGSGGHVQQHLGCASERDIFAMQQDFANRFTELGGSGISEAGNRLALGFQVSAKQIDLSRFARTVDSVERNEHYRANPSASSFGAV
jgi:hypothetical protein